MNSLANRFFSCLLMAPLFVCPTARGQAIFYNPNDERFKGLYLEKARSEYSLNKEEFERQKDLFGKGLISNKEYKESEGKFVSAKVTYQQAILSILFEQPHLLIDRAVKYQHQSGLRKVRLDLRNSTPPLTRQEKDRVEDFGNELQTDRIQSVYVSLVNDQGAIVSQPYEKKIEELIFGHPVTLEFVLLQDLDYLVVRIIYGNKVEEKKIFLQKDETAEQVLITSNQFSQEGDLGGKVVYDLTLELFSSVLTAYKLDCFGLPAQFSFEFMDKQSGARLSQIRFSPEGQSNKISLAVYLPDRLDSTAFVIDRSIDFLVVMIRNDQSRLVDGNRVYEQDDLQKLGISNAKLELVPRGMGRIQVRASNFYKEITRGEDLVLQLSLNNIGTRRLDDLRMVVGSPTGWVSRVSPEMISHLEPNHERSVEVNISPVPDVNIGDYEISLAVEALSGAQRIAAADKKFRVHISDDTGPTGMVILVIVLVVIVAGVAIVGIRLIRK